jgi:hypothetical protein
MHCALTILTAKNNCGLCVVTTLHSLLLRISKKTNGCAVERKNEKKKRDLSIAS